MSRVHLSGAERWFRAYECTIAYLHAPNGQEAWTRALARNFDPAFAALARNIAAAIQVGARKYKS